MDEKTLKDKPDAKKICKDWGIGLIIGGIIPFVFPELLDMTIGIIVLILGIITSVFRKKWNLALIGAFIILLGAWNIRLTLLINMEHYSFLFLGIIQILIGLGALNQYHQLGEEIVLVKKKKGNNGNGFGIASLVLGILSILISIFIPLIAIVMGILGIVFSVKQRNESPNGVGTAGLVTSIIGLIMGIIAWIIYIIIFV